MTEKVFNFDSIIDQYNQIPSSVVTEVERFLNSNASHRYLFGRNEYAEAVLKEIDFEAIVDDFAAPRSFWKKKPVI